jgi:hypothetical protein
MEPHFTPIDRDLVISDVEPGYQDAESEDTMFTTDSFDYLDDTAVRELFESVERALQLPAPLRVTILNVSEWEQEVRLRTEGRPQIFGHNCLIDHADSRHLLVSPACVEGVNRRDRQTVAEILDTVWGGLYERELTQLSPLLRAGLRHMVIDLCGQSYGMERLAKVAPYQAKLVRAFAQVLALEPLFNEWRRTEVTQLQVELEWAQLLATDTDRFFLALRKSGFGSCWLERVSQDAEVAAALNGIGDLERRALKELCTQLRDARLTIHEPLFRVSVAAALDYVEQQAAAIS